MKNLFKYLCVIVLLAGTAFAQTPSINLVPNGNQLSVTTNTPSGVGILWRVKQVNGTWYLTLVTAQNNQPNIYDYVVTITPLNDPNPPLPPPVPTPLVISTESLPNGTVGVSYKQAIAVNGGVPPYTTVVASAYLPKGIELKNNEVVGTPSEAGTSNFVIKATDGKGQTAQRQYTLIIGGQPPPPPVPVGPIYVLIVYDPDKLDNVPISQSSIITSSIIRQYLDSKCAKDTSGKPWWKFLSYKLTEEEIKKLEPNYQEWYKDAAKNSKSSGKFWITITNGKDKYSGELPENTDKTLEILKKYGG